MPAEAFGKAGPAPYLGITVELTLMAMQGGVKINRPRYCVAPQLVCLPCGSMGKKDIFLHPSPLPLTATVRADPRVMRLGKLALFLTYCSTQAREPRISPRQQDRQLALVVGLVGELAPRP